MAGVEISWDLYKPSGKWVYGGKVTISGKHAIWDDVLLLQEIDDLQDQVVKGLIVRRSYCCVIKETDAQTDDPDYHGFYHYLYNARP